jgi:hypothetical protein
MGIQVSFGLVLICNTALTMIPDPNDGNRFLKRSECFVVHMPTCYPSVQVPGSGFFNSPLEFMILHQIGLHRDAFRSDGMEDCPSLCRLLFDLRSCCYDCEGHSVCDAQYILMHQLTGYI